MLRGSTWSLNGFKLTSIDALIETHEEYASFNSIMEINPIRVTLLSPGTFQEYLEEKQAQGADLGHFKPPRMQPCPIRLSVD